MEQVTSKEFINGATAICRGAIDAGCNFFTGYPITPASGILAFMMKHLPAYDGICLQGEDEIASIGMCLAAAMAGKRVMTATSGPGLSLYSENIGLAIMGEVPMVIVNVQRYGPATGAATTGAEGDVQFVQWVTSGGIPMVVLSPVDLPTTYRLTTLAFQISEKLRIPVILNSSKDLVMTSETVDTKLFQKEKVVPRKIYEGKKNYSPYFFKNCEDVPDFLPIGANQQVRFTTSMHDENAVLTKDPEKMGRLFKHLAQKILARQKELEFYDLDTNDNAKTVIIATGVSARIARSVVQKAKDKGKDVDLLCLYTLWPIPKNIILKAAQNKDRILVPEHNLGLYLRELERFLPKEKLVGISRVDGNLITEESLLKEIL